MQNVVKDAIAVVREAELRALAHEGWPVEAQTRWHWIVKDHLHIWPAVGRWLNSQTGARGKMHGLSMRALLEQQGIQRSSAASAGQGPARSPPPPSAKAPRFAQN